jgi:hypothetical protein
MELLTSLLRTLAVTVWDVLPIAVIIFGFQFFVIRRKIAHLKRVLIGFAYVLLGLSFFLEGLERALFPLGRLMAEQLTDPAFILGDGASFGSTLDWRLYFWVYAYWSSHRPSLHRSPSLLWRTIQVGSRPRR